MDARADMDELLNALLPFAQQMIEQHGEFYPSGASMTAQGEVSLVAADTGEEMPASQDLIQALTGSLRQRADADEIRAAAIVADVVVELPDVGRTDAIQVSIEHQQGDPIAVLIPYSKKGRRGWEFGDLIATAGERSIFS